jgi:hypothetical protein
MNNQKTLVLFALIAVLGLVTVVAVDIILTTQEAESSVDLTVWDISQVKGNAEQFWNK